MRDRVLSSLLIWMVSLTVTAQEEPLFFSSPKGAVGLISELISAKKWSQLTRYYHLDDTDVEKERLLSGEFFLLPLEQRVGPPGVSDIREPFSPGFSYQSHQLEIDGLYRVRVSIAIEQGEGMALRGRDQFWLRRSPSGYQLVPNRRSVGIKMKDQPTLGID